MNEDDSWIKALVVDTTYRGIDVRREYGKMVNWCRVNNARPTRRRFINWLNRIDRVVTAPTPTCYTNVKRKTRDPSDEEFKLAGEIARKELERFRRNLYKRSCQV